MSYNPNSKDDLTRRIKELEAENEKLRAQLERELAEAREQIQHLEKLHKNACELIERHAGYAHQARQQRDALARIGGKLRDVCPSSCDDYAAEWDKALNTVPKASTHSPEKHLVILHDNPTQFDYLHAIRALASRLGYREIFDLADKGMNVKEESS